MGRRQDRSPRDGGGLAAALARQVEANRSGVGQEAYSSGHRARLTRELAERAPAGGGGRLCLLGAGNASDVDLDVLLQRYAEVHLVDIDVEAVARARARVAAPAGRLVVHAPVDLLGVGPHLEGWARQSPDPAALVAAFGQGLDAIVGRLPGPFDVVASCCMLTQLQLVLLEVVGDDSPAFAPLRAALNQLHVFTLAGLLAPGGRALLVVDLTSSETYPPLDDLPEGTDLGALMKELLAAGNVIAAAHPGALSGVVRANPSLRALYDVRFPVGPWLWRNGPDSTFLVYALEIARSGP